MSCQRVWIKSYIFGEKKNDYPLSVNLWSVNRWTGAIDVNAFRFGNDDATGIEAVEGNQKDKAVIYDLTVRRMEKAVKGLYIIDGKKVVIK